jgi:hypothetical protein
MEDLEEIQIEDEVDEDEVPVQYDIATYPSDFTLSGIHKMWHDGDIEIPPFQRGFVWTIKQSSLLIESFLLGLPVPPVFFYIDEEHKNLVIDGQQRILSVVYYLDGYFGEESPHGKRQIFRLTGLDERSPFHENRLQDLPPSDQRKLQTSVLRSINVRQLSPKEDNTSMYHIFERLNTGGTALKPQEIRNCVFRGDLVEILKRLNQDKNWRSILGSTTSDKHQKDIELVLRVFSLSGNRWASYEKPMKEYLNVHMRKSRKGKSKEVRLFSTLFPKACELITKKLGGKPFHIRGPINTSVMDSVFCTILDNIDKVPLDIDKRYKALVHDADFLESITGGTTDTSVLKSRFEKAQELLLG